MKTIIKKKSKIEIEKRKYPYIGHCNVDNVEHIVLFISPSSGMSLISNTLVNVGDFLRNWSESSFEVFDGEVTLKN